jgi:hypothetical protein
MKKFPLILILLIFLFSCKKKNEEATTSPVFFTSTTYNIVGTYDETGKPSNLGIRENISSDLLSYSRTTLPNSVDLRTTNPELLTTKAIADISLSQKSDIKITYVSSEATGASNAFGFYTYPTNAPPASAADIKVITYIFPNAGGGTPLQPGDNVNIGTFEAGTTVGFVLLQAAWDITKKSLNNNAVHFCSNDVLNPEFSPALKKHAVLINYAPLNKILIGFEDTDRTDPKCDHDFNDAVFYATVTPK